MESKEEVGQAALGQKVRDACAETDVERVDACLRQTVTEGYCFQGKVVYCLRIPDRIDPTNPGIVIDLKEEGPTLIGRTAPDYAGRRVPDIKLDCLYLSSNHCEIRIMANGDITIQDVGSRNGTKVDGDCLAPFQWNTIDSNQLVKIGKIEFYVVEKSMLDAHTP